MAKKALTEKELREQLAALENSKEINRLAQELADAKATVTRLQATVSQQTNELRMYKESIKTIQEAMRGIDLKTRTHGPSTARGAAAIEASAAAARGYSAYVRAGISNGTHDPETGIEYSVETGPKPKNFSDPKTVVREGDLAKFFPAINGPTETPVVTEE